MSKETIQAHPFELAGMGLGPYSFGGIIELPDLSENSASNFGNPDPYKEVREAGLKAGAGTCACCGMAIRVICVVIDGAGDRWGVGSDCVEKIDSPSLRNAAKVAVAKRRNRLARERKEVKRQERQLAWEAALSTDSRALDGETNGALRVRLFLEAGVKHSAREAKQSQAAEILRPLAEVIRDGQGGFCDSIASDLQRGVIPYGRGLNLTIEIYAKRHGRRNSNAFEAANLQAGQLIEKAQEVLK